MFDQIDNKTEMHVARSIRWVCVGWAVGGWTFACFMLSLAYHFLVR